MMKAKGESLPIKRNQSVGRGYMHNEESDLLIHHVCQVNFVF